MLMPRRSGFDIFDEVFDNDPFFSKKENKFMKTDVKEKEGEYILEIDLPGYEKSNISVELDKGYLTVTAKKQENSETKNEKENYLHQERYFGECSRSYFVGENIKQENIQATFKNGTLELIVPKEEPKQVENKRYIPIGE